MNELDMTVEIELGVTGGEEDGVDNTILILRTLPQPDEVNQAYSFIQVSNRFTMPTFNVTEFKPGNVELTQNFIRFPEFLKEKHGLSGKPIHFVFMVVLDLPVSRFVRPLIMGL